MEEEESLDDEASQERFDLDDLDLLHCGDGGGSVTESAFQPVPDGIEEPFFDGESESESDEEGAEFDSEEKDENPAKGDDGVFCDDPWWVLGEKDDGDEG